MAESPMVEEWAASERILRGVLSQFSANMSDDARRWIEEFLDHNELGLAAETLRANIDGPCPSLDELIKKIG